MNIDPTTLTIGELFNGVVNYSIPIYQRNYAWGEAQIGQLIRDVFDCMEKDSAASYYIGTLVVHERLSSEGRVEFEVIDGQQRLTTLALLLCVLKNETIATVEDDRAEIDLKARLKFFGNPCLTFDCRRSSTEILHSLFCDGLKAGIQNQENSLRHGYALTQKKLAQLVKGRIGEFADYLLERVRIVRVVVPEDTDLNHYFEIMNSRGEQLEKHEILKAKLMEVVPDESHRKCFGRIWDACSDMDCYVQYGFSIDERNNIFGCEWNDFVPRGFDKLVCVCQNNNANGQHDNSTTFADEKTLEDLISPGAKKKMTSAQTEVEAEGRFKSIVNFQNFLLHVLSVYMKKPVSLDDKQLISTFDDTIDAIPTTAEKVAFIEGFAFELLQCRFLFDKYVIKRENDEKLALRRLKTYRDGKGKVMSVKPISTFYDDELGNGSMKTHREIEMLLAMFHVSYPSMVYKYWLNGVLVYLARQNLPIDADSYRKFLVEMAERFLRHRFLADDGKEKEYEDLIFKAESEIGPAKVNGGKIDRGTAVENFVFNYLDYKLWLQDLKSKKPRFSSFEFTIRSSVEHYYPQQPMGGMPELSDGDLNSFGNLCLISASRNSRLSNMPPLAKKEVVVGGGLVVESIKQRIMMDEHVWDAGAIRNHRKAMVGLLLPETLLEV